MILFLLGFAAGLFAFGLALALFLYDPPEKPAAKTARWEIDPDCETSSPLVHYQLLVDNGYIKAKSS